ncbi:hypothetical protein QTI66_08735 [Variovorax sp. J22R133]|uniref:hypothetical protein n=1 Tax=Variovorax brevis TaxID=3053503 RepID=UPI0025767904|nr:hypothetical protein [Variovorax sp. J22R133]MDM0112234.1 hypothetical protein [Variovorax sp. J22R133]
MSIAMPERLYKLLPAVQRVRDAQQGEPLRALLAIIEGELERIEADTANLYDNWFIETCDEWVVPYIGDLLGVRPIRAVESAGVSARAYVANTIAYRRRKGTAVVLEQLARDTTGWPARAVEFFTRLATTQHMNHVRSAPPATPGIRNAATAELVDTAFDGFGHTADVRRAATRGGRYNIPNVGLFLWRLRSYAVGAGAPGDESPDFASARDMGGWWSIHPTGCDSPLFNQPRTETTITHLAEEDNVPGALRRLALHAEFERMRQGVNTPPPRFMTDTDPVLRVWARLDGESTPQEVQRRDMYICNIPYDVQLASPVPRALALDPERGRLAFPVGLDVREVWVQSSYGFSGDMGGGPYDRSASVREANQSVAIEISAAGDVGGFFDPGVWQAGVSHLLPDDGSGTLFPSLREAVEAWNLQPPGRTGVIVMMDSLTDTDMPGSPSAPLEIGIAERSQLLIVAGEWPLQPIAGAPPGSVERVPGRFDAQQIRAHVIGDVTVRGTAPDASANAGACFINGLLIEGQLIVAPGQLATLALAHCSLIPGSGALVVQPGGNERLTLTVDKSICAAIQVPGPIRGIAVADSIVGTDNGSPDLSLDAPATELGLERSSFFGAVVALSLSASDCIFSEPVQALRRQTGCVRFCYVPPSSTVPRRYRCQPQLETTTRLDALHASAAQEGRVATKAEEDAITAEVAALIRPLFVSRQYGDPGFGQLELRCATQIRTGAESGAEMGAFEFLKQPQREANLRGALDEYLRFGLEAGLFFST